MLVFYIFVGIIKLFFKVGFGKVMGSDIIKVLGVRGSLGGRGCFIEMERREKDYIMK